MLSNAGFSFSEALAVNRTWVVIIINICYGGCTLGHPKHKNVVKPVPFYTFTSPETQKRNDNTCFVFNMLAVLSAKQ